VLRLTVAGLAALGHSSAAPFLAAATATATLSALALTLSLAVRVLGLT
jgi:hypothetical protein